MATKLRYHQAVCDLIEQQPTVSAARLSQLHAIESRLNLRLPAALIEWFALEQAEALFSDHTTPDYLVGIDELAESEYIQHGYIPIAYENQGVVTWYARLDGSDDPPIYDDHDGDALENWNACSATLSNFIQHMIAIGMLDQEIGQLVLIADDQRPDDAWLQQILAHTTATPRSDRPQRARFGFFNQHGRISIRCQRDSQSAEWQAHWAFEAPTPEDLLVLVRQALPFGTLAATLQERSTDPAIRELETQVLSEIRLL